MTDKRLFSKPMRRLTLAEQMAATVEEAILDGQLDGGAALPTEPELAEQFGVSRSVVRDATRILMARGLVEVQHGRGVFVTEPAGDAFGDALLLALRRSGATAWDVEQFGQIILPEVAALAAASASEEEIAGLEQLIGAYLESVADHHRRWWGQATPTAELEKLTAAYHSVMEAVFAATHNRVLQQIARPLLRLQNLRRWADTEEESPESVTAVETAYFEHVLAAIAGRDPDQARATLAWLMELPPEAVEAMRQTPVGEIAVIPIPLPTQRHPSYPESPG